MAPTEQKILTNYLLVPAQLPAIISLDEFVALFPRPLQSSPRIRSLYRDLQSQRNAVIDSVAEQIEAETKQGKAMRRAVIRSKREADAQEQDDEVEIERMVSSDPGCCE
jgi:centromere-localized protein 2